MLVCSTAAIAATGATAVTTTISGHRWLPLAIIGDCWLPLATAGDCWQPVVTAFFCSNCMA